MLLSVWKQVPCACRVDKVPNAPIREQFSSHFYEHLLRIWKQWWQDISFFDNHCFLSLISIFGTKSFIVQLSKRIIFEGVVLLNCRKKQSAIYSVCMEHPHMTLKCCSAVSRALTFSFNWMILWKVTINVSKNLRGECYPKDQIKRDSLVMLKRTDYVINLLVNLVSSYSELKTLLARPAQLIIKAL